VLEIIVGLLRVTLAVLVEIRLLIGIFLENVALAMKEPIAILMTGQKFVRWSTIQFVLTLQVVQEMIVGLRQEMRVELVGMRRWIIGTLENALGTMKRIVEIVEAGSFDIEERYSKKNGKRNIEI